MLALIEALRLTRQVLSLLPAMSTPIMLAEFLRKPVEDVRVLMSAVGATGLIRERRNGRYVFSHDRQKVTYLWCFVH